MLTQLSTLTQRLAILETDTQYDAALTSVIKALSARFDRECHRRFARTENATEEFSTGDTEIAVAGYPIEAVTRFEAKSSAVEGWVEQTAPDYLIRRACVISLASPFGHQPLAFSLSRVTYTGGYVLPGDPDPDYQPSANTRPPARLPDDLEQAATEQVAAWFQNRGGVGLTSTWPYHGTYQQIAQLPLLIEVKAVLKLHTRWRL